MRRRLSLVPTLLAGCALHGMAAADEPPLPQTVVVSATRHAMALVDAPAAMSVVTPAQIAERGADNVFEALRGETGLSLIGRTISGRRNLSLRGMDGRHTLFLVDGMRIGGTDGVVGHSDFQYDWVPVQDIERIEVLRGPMSVLYGAEALGGVVNVVTRTPGEQWRFGVLAEGSWASGGQGGDGHRAALSASGPLGEQFRLGVTASDSRRDEITNAAEPRLGDIEGHHKRDGALRLAWLPAAGHQVDLQHRAGDEDRWAGVRERSGQKRWHVSMHDIQREHTSLGWNADWGGDWATRSQLRAYASHAEVRNTRTLGVAALRPQTLNDRVVEGQASVAPRTGQLYTAGFEWRDEQLDNVGLPGGHGAVRHQSAFGQAEWQALSSLALTAGLRHDHHGRFGSQWSPRAYAVWRPAGDWVVKGGVGRGFKAPTLKQISADYREDEGPYTYFGNAALKPERNTSTELGVGWQGREAGFQAMLFHNQVRNLIVPRFTGTVAGRGQYQFDNIDRARLQGLELEARQRWTTAGAGTWQLDANYTWLDATDTNGARLEKRPRHLLAVQLGWQQGPWQASLRAEHHAGQLIAPATVGQPLQPLPDLTRLSAQVTRQLNKALSLSLGVDNLGNLRLADESPLFTWAEAPRTWRVTLRGVF